MRRIIQTLEDITSRLQRIESDWEDATSDAIREHIAHINGLIQKGKQFNRCMIAHLLSQDFKNYLLLFRLFMEMSKDDIEGFLREEISEGIGIKAFQKNPKAFVNFFANRGLTIIMNEHFKRDWNWNDIIIERLKAGRGSAIRGQKRGRFGENAVEDVIKNVFGEKYDKNCNFIGMDGKKAKAEFAIPKKEDPDIVFEVKCYGATGSKQTDVRGDIQKIIDAKKPRTTLLIVTDGITWLARLSDLRAIVEFQNNGQIDKLYTLSMVDELESDLADLKKEYGL